MPLLALPDHRQSTDYGCADAALAVVLDYHRICARPRIATPPDGADPRHLESTLRKLGLRVVAGEMALADLGHFCATGRPPICLVHWPEDNTSHYLVARGLSGGRVYFHDVWDGRGRLLAPEFEAIWWGSGRLGEAFRSWAIVGWPAVSAKPSVQ